MCGLTRVWQLLSITIWRNFRVFLPIIPGLWYANAVHVVLWGWENRRTFAPSLAP